VGVVLEVIQLKTPLSNLGVQVVVVEKVTELEEQELLVKGIMGEMVTKLGTMQVVGEVLVNPVILMEMGGVVMD
tara:strand:+ start:273 stop:494 length:222 start_codon:yes stop_codon:yes gene_type:complete